MPFFDDSGIAAEKHRGQVIRAFAVFGEQVERMVAVNIAWALQLLPAAVALAAPALPGGIRIGLVILTSLLLIPATGVLYALVASAMSGSQIDVASARTAIREMALPSVRALTPLGALLWALVWTAVMAGAGGLVAVDVVAKVGVLVLLVVASFWGPMLVAHPQPTAVLLLAWSALLVWRHPGATLKTALTAAVVAALGVVTVAGLVLAVPALVALLHTSLFMQIEKGAGTK